MKGPLDERTPPMTPQLALRVAIIGCFALVMFAVIFFRLWFLQVLSGQPVRRGGAGQHCAGFPVPAQRGEIVDRAARRSSSRSGCRRSRSPQTNCPCM